MMTVHEKKLHDEYDQADAGDKRAVDDAYTAALDVLQRDGRKLCKCDGAERLVAALWRYFTYQD